MSNKITEFYIGYILDSIIMALNSVHPVCFLVVVRPVYIRVRKGYLTNYKVFEIVRFPYLLFVDFSRAFFIFLCFVCYKEYVLYILLCNVFSAENFTHPFIGFDICR